MGEFRFKGRGTAKGLVEEPDDTINVEEEEMDDDFVDTAWENSGMPLNGRLLLRDSVFLAESVLRDDLNDKDLKKRIVVFAGGDIYDSKDDANRLGLWLKKHDIACDAVNFGHQSSSNKREVFEALVAGAQNKGNSHILHVKDDTSVSEALSSSPIIPTRVGPPPELKNKQHYLQNPYIGTAELISEMAEWMWENAEHINAAAKARRIAEAAEAEYYKI
ncbi:26S proteasome non-ATPase regulatory subunit 4-like protein [Artemisia annua]|uniref:26S proteasome non-ATPase regulatory subunit 4-like protein n=1 Tax=Artemisia annua TaxID=35608 RepID=A0A2U1LAM4_ARTAN|nr:26S proteasome non-ATPase regulatory subunit 4-like protein [Artemisia annua]